eukprot:g2665.t1
MSWDLGSYKPFDFPVPHFEDGLISNMSAPTPRSRCSTGFENSAFGSGSSVLSLFEPPSDAELLPRQSTMNICEATLPRSQEELEAVISNLQAVYLYRQGLKALAAERQLSSKNIKSDVWTDSGQLVQSPTNLPLVPSTVPGSANSIWRMDSNDTALKSHYSLYQDTPLTRAKIQERGNVHHHHHNYSMDTTNTANTAVVGAGRRQRRKNHRQNSAPVNLSAPQWADASWNPRMIVKGNSSQSTGHGTGVFIPPHLSCSSVTYGEQDKQNQPK